MDEFYIGGAVSKVSKRGDILLPPTFRRTARLRAGAENVFLLIDRHPSDHCLIVSDRTFINDQTDTNDAAACDSDAVCASAQRADDVARRRRFAFAVETELHAHGQLPLPALARRLLPLGDRVLLVSTGHQFQIWDLEFVLAHGAPDLIALAHLHLAVTDPIGGFYESHMPAPVAPRRLVLAGEPRLPVQPMLPVPH